MDSITTAALKAFSLQGPGSCAISLAALLLMLIGRILAFCLVHMGFILWYAVCVLLVPLKYIAHWVDPETHNYLPQYPIREASPPIYGFSPPMILKAHQHPSNDTGVSMHACTCWRILTVLDHAC